VRILVCAWPWIAWITGPGRLLLLADADRAAGRTGGGGRTVRHALTIARKAGLSRRHGASPHHRCPLRGQRMAADLIPHANRQHVAGLALTMNPPATFLPLAPPNGKSARPNREETGNPTGS